MYLYIDVIGYRSPSLPPGMVAKIAQVATSFIVLRYSRSITRSKDKGLYRRFR